MTEKIYGINSVLEALKSPEITVDKIFILKTKKDKRIQEIIKLGKECNAKIRFYEKDFFKKFSNLNHQGIICEVIDFSYTSIEELYNKNFIIVLDSITDMQNFGNIIRTSAFFGVDGIVIPKDRSVNVNNSVVKTSSGGIFKVPISKVTNLNQAVLELKENNFLIIGTSSNGKSTFDDIPYTDKICLIFGNEEKGIRKSLLQKCDFVVNIKGCGNFDSLNVASAAAISIYEINKKIKKEL